MRIILILLVLALTACGGGQAVAPVGTYNKQVKKTYKPAKAPSFYTVKKVILYFRSVGVMVMTIKP